jgi:hypothetical protein
MSYQWEVWVTLKGNGGCKQSVHSIFSAKKVGAVCSSGTVNVYYTTLHHIPEDGSHCCKNLTTNITSP